MPALMQPFRLRPLQLIGQTALVVVLLALASPGPAQPAGASLRPRVVVLSDYFKDPDDKQSFIRFLTYSNEFEVEGLIATSLAFGDGAVRPELLREQIADYAEVFPSLQKHGRPDFEYPTPAALLRVVKAGAPVVRRPAGGRNGFPVPYPAGAKDSRNCSPAEDWIGAGKDTEASEHIITVVDREDPRPVWVVVWGGAMDLAQALWKVEHTRNREERSRFVAKLRLCQSNWQDTGSVWIWEHVPDLFFLQSIGLAQGMYAEGPAALRDEAWLQKNVVNGHGRLGAGYPAANARGKTELVVKEGDSPTFLHLLAAGLSDPEQPEQGGWGGRFQRVDAKRNFFVPAEDAHPESTDPARRVRWTLARWNEAIANDFAARMDRCVSPPDKVNHPPIAVVDGDATSQVLHRRIGAGSRLVLDAAGTRDPDGHSVQYRWWQYVEGGSLAAPLVLENAASAQVGLVAPRVSQPETIHLILSVTDDGVPQLTSYRRVVVTLRP